MGLCQNGPLMVESAGFLHARSSLAEQDRISSEPEDEIEVAPMGEDLDDLWGGEMTVATDEDMRVWPVAAQIGQEPDQDHGVLGARGPLARSEAGGH